MTVKESQDLATLRYNSLLSPFIKSTHSSVNNLLIKKNLLNSIIFLLHILYRLAFAPNFKFSEQLEVPVNFDD